jgi:deoxyribodipyrimidine photo-lyase
LLPENIPFVHPDRVRRLNGQPWRAGRYVLYWMQQAQRAQDNPALSFACGQAQRLGLPVVVAFGLMRRYPQAGLRHFRFMLEGLAETRAELDALGIPLVVRWGEPAEVALTLAGEAAGMVCDRAYLPPLASWREQVACEAACAVWQVETELVVPADAASLRMEVAARTLRPRLKRLLPEHLHPLAACPEQTRKAPPLTGESLADLEALCAELDVDCSLGTVSRFFPGGPKAAEMALQRFLHQGLADYATARRQPEAENISGLSPYLQYGQISSIRVALAVAQAGAGSDADRDAFLEELIVRRELAHNHVLRNSAWNAYDGLPAWARATLAAHATDPRPHLYDLKTLEAGATHDPYWNAAMAQARLTGYMHNHLRMYWGKKILEWSPTPEEAFRRCLDLNHRYFLDGLAPSSYANVGWIFGLHDRPWPERPVFGTVRYMNAAGLERKCDMPAYLARIKGLQSADIKTSHD